MKGAKNLVWFLIITVAISWPLFFLPMAFRGQDPAVQQTIAMASWSVAMLVPALAALIVTHFVAGESLRTLNLGRLGPKRFYLWAWLVPPVLGFAALGAALLTGLGQFDSNFTFLKESMGEAAATGFNPWIVVGGQLLLAFTLAPLFNTIFGLGEELGWRGFLLPRLEHLGRWRAILISNVIWGLWHAPAIVQGHNFPGQPILGIPMMVVWTLLLGAFFSWLYFETRSPWAPALAHGAVNAVAGLPMLFLVPGVDIILGGTLPSVTAWIGLALFVGWLALTRRLPGRAEGA